LEVGVTAPKVLAIIPARGGSKGLPGKNIRSFAGLPLIAHSILCAKDCPSIARIVVSTDSDQIAATAIEYGAEVPFRRPAELATDTAPMWPVIKHALAQAESAFGEQYDAVVLLDPTSPARLPSDVESALATLTADPRCDGVIGVSEPEFSPYWHCVVEEGDYLRDLFPKAKDFDRRQDVPVVYCINASLYAWRRSLVTDSDNWRSGRLRPHVVPAVRAIHIDEIHQFEIAELMVRHGLLALPWLKGGGVVSDSSLAGRS
jgi:CMP-N,N'-diacetyllegionaminic acid synthase